MKPMLAAKTDGKGLSYPLLASPKLDGVRALIINGIVMSRSFKPIPNAYVQKLFGRPEYNGLDGELIVGTPTDKDVYRNTTSGVMSQAGEPDVSYHVFDKFDHGGGFHDRLRASQEIIRRLDPVIPVVPVEHRFIACEQTLLALEEQYLADGYEGVMLRQQNGPYKHGRSTEREGWLLKLKRFDDSEAVILSAYELMHNANEATQNELGYTERSSHKAGMVGKGILGGLSVRDVYSGVEFDIGTGFDQATREALWKQRDQLPEQIIKYKFFASGVKDKPRFPVFLGFRSDL